MDIDPQDAVDTIAMASRAGLTVEAMSRGHAKVRVPFEGNGNHFGTMYAGGPFLAAEILGGILCMGSFDVTRFFPLVTGMDLRFTAVATTDVTVEVTVPEDELVRIETEAGETGRAKFQLATEVKDLHGNVVATNTGHYQLRTLDNVPTL